MLKKITLVAVANLVAATLSLGAAEAGGYGKSHGHGHGYGYHAVHKHSNYGYGYTHHYRPTYVYSHGCHVWSHKGYCLKWY